MIEKQNWLEALKKELKQLPEDDREDILDNYREQISQMLAEGSTEDEILQRLGSPKDVAKEAKLALGYESKFNFNQEQVINHVKKGVNAATNQLNEALENKRSNGKPTLEQVLFIILCAIFLIVAFSVGSAGLGFIVGGVAVFIVSFLFIHFTWSLFFLLLSISILLVNTGITIFYGLYVLGRYFIRHFK